MVYDRSKGEGSGARKGPADELRRGPGRTGPELTGPDLSKAEFSPFHTIRRSEKDEASGFQAISLGDSMRRDPHLGGVLLESFYEQFVLAFPDKNEVHPIESYRRALKIDPNLNIDIQMFDSRIAGGAVTRTVDTEQGKIGVTEHIFIAQGFRGKGLGKTLNGLINERAAREGAVAIVQEVSDPRLIDPQKRAMDLASGISPEGRVAFWSKLGFLTLDAPYAQPAFGKDRLPVFCDMLTIKPLSEKLKLEQRISSESYVEIMRAYFQTFLSDVSRNPTFSVLAGSVKESDWVGFIPMDNPRSYLEPSFWHQQQKSKRDSVG